MNPQKQYHTVILKRMCFVKYDDSGDIVRTTPLNKQQTQEVMDRIELSSTGEGGESVEDYAIRHGYDAVQWDAYYEQEQ